jgi:hypothetical protein
MTTLSSFTPTSFTLGSAANFTVNGSGIPPLPGPGLIELTAAGVTWAVNISTIVVSSDGSTLTFSATPSCAGGGPLSGKLQLALMIIMTSIHLQQSVTYH